MKVLVAIPTKRGMLFRRANDSILQLEWGEQLDIMYLLGGDPEPLYWNNLLTKLNDAREVALNGGYDALLTIESDIIVPPDALKKMAAVDADVVYGLFALRLRYCQEHPWNVSTVLSEEGMTYLSDNVEAARAAWGKVIDSQGHGQGICLIHRNVLERFEFRTPQPMVKAPDWYISIDCQEAGFTQKHHLGVVCGHIDIDTKPLRTYWPDPVSPVLYSVEFAGRIEHAQIDEPASMSALYKHFVGPADLVFNIGANIGMRTQIFTDLGADVVAVDPQPAMCEALRARFGDAVAVVEAAAGPEEGEGELWLCTDNELATCAKGWAEALQDRWPMEKWHKKVTVPMVTLDGLIERYGEPDFCKIDTEGYEINVLKGLTQPLKALCFEYTVPFIGPALECVDYLAALGMTKFNYIVQEEMRFVLSRWVGAEEIKQHLAALPEKTFYGDVFALRGRSWE